MTCPLRPHHGMCLAFYRGVGYSSVFTANMTALQARLERGVPVTLTLRCDRICSACPNNRRGSCTDSEKVAEYDQKVLAACGLAEGDVLPFGEFSRLVQEKILRPGLRETICGDCQWNDLCR